MLSLMYQANNPMVYELRRKPGTNVFRPRSAEHREDESTPGLLIARIEGRVYFANAQNVGEKLRELVESAMPTALILDCGGSRVARARSSVVADWASSGVMAECLCLI